MPKRQHHRDKSGHGLRRAIATALALKLIALTVIYLAFFVPAAGPVPGDRAATAVLGLAR